MVADAGGGDYKLKEDLTLEPPCWIGDQCLFKDMTRMRTVVCLTHTELLTLPKDMFDDIVAEFPLIMPWYSGLQAKVLSGDLVSAGIQCKGCQGFGHPYEDCPNAKRESILRKRATNMPGNFMRTLKKKVQSLSHDRQDPNSTQEKEGQLSEKLERVCKRRVACG